MAPRARRLSFDFIHRSLSSETHTSPFSPITELTSNQNEVIKSECDCCGLSEDCTRAYVGRIRDRFFGRWLCGLCSEAVNEEVKRSGLPRHVVGEKALNAHMEVCRKFNECVRANPAMTVAGAMTQLLRNKSKRSGGSKVFRTRSAIPSLGH